MTRRNTILTATAGLIAVALTGLIWLHPDTIDVDTARIERGPVRVTIDEDGETRIRHRFVISAPVAGRLSRLACEEGTTVDAGDVVAILYPLPLDARSREEGVARLRAAQASVGEAEARLEEAELAAAHARRELARSESMAKQNVIAPRELEAARTLERTSSAVVRALQLRVDAAVHERELAAAAVRSTTETRAGIEVRAPARGKVLRIQQECERVIPAGTPILEIGDPSDLELVIDVLSDDATAIEPGAEVLATSGPDSDTLRGRVRLVEPAGFTKLSPLGVEEHRVNVIADLDSVPAGLGDRFRIDARIVTWQVDNAVRAPAGALFREGQEWAAFVVRNRRAVKVVVVPGRRGASEAEIINGLVPGDVVILHPSERVVSGVRVHSNAGGTP
jgi:HlyD family secretion protein